MPNTLAQVPIARVSYLSIDMNCAAPKVAALKFFWSRLERGSFVVLDDYAYSGYEPQKRAIDALSMELGFDVVSLPTGQGLIVRE